MKSFGGIFLIAVVYFSQLKKTQADMEEPLAAVPVPVQTPAGPDREGPTCPTCCQEGGPVAVPAVPGDPGHEGPNGLLGLPGEKGDPGLQGFKGAAGVPGVPGETGEPGLRGKPGTGPTGRLGPKGLAGFEGAKGSSGNYGPKGYSKRGKPGLDGLDGVKGSQGSKGKQGYDYQTSVFFTLRRKAPFSSISDTTRLSFDGVVAASPDATMIDLDMGMFTCPWHGTYVFTFSVLKSNDTELPLRVHLFRNEEDVVSAQTTSPAEKNHPIGGSATLDLRRGDTVFLTCYGSVRNVRDSIEYSSFSGFRLK